MSREDFIKKYPELSENNSISEVKILLLKGYMLNQTSDTKIKNLINDYDNMILCENRNSKINYIIKSEN